MLSPSAVAAVRDAARAVLAGDDAPAFRLPADVTADAFVEATDRHRLLPFFSLNLDRLDLADDLRATIAARGQRERMPALMMARELFRAVDTLTDAGVRVLTFKGIALAQQAYGDFTARGSGDLDLLVSPDDLVTARAALVNAGWAADPAYPAPGPSWAWRHTLRTYYQVPLQGRASSIDLHWHLDPARDAFPDFEASWGRRAQVDLAGRSLSTLSPPDALAHSCSHAAKDNWSWVRSLVDVHRLSSHDAAWGRSAPVLRRGQRVTLGLALTQLGPSPATPGHVAAAAEEAARRYLSVATARQVGGTGQPVGRLPGGRLALQIRDSSRSAAGVADVARVVGMTVLPPSDLGASRSPVAFRAVPAALTARRHRLAIRVREWRTSRAGNPDARP